MPLTTWGETEPYDPMDWEFEPAEPWTGPRCGLCTLPVMDGAHRYCPDCEAYLKRVEAQLPQPKPEPLSTDFSIVPF